jgi:hypothetical protein
MQASPLCSQCQAPLQTDDQFCQSCGASLVPESAAPAAAAAVPSLSPAPFADLASHHTGREVQRASRWLIILAVLFAIFGTFFGMKAKSEADTALDQISFLDDSHTLPVDGETYTVAELRQKVKQEVWLIFGANYFLAVIMVGLFFWAKRNPLSAMVTGLAIYLAVIVLNAIIDPKTIVQGILIKFIFIGAMVGGIKAALAEREWARSAP